MNQLKFLISYFWNNPTKTAHHSEIFIRAMLKSQSIKQYQSSFNNSILGGPAIPLNTIFYF